MPVTYSELIQSVRSQIRVVSLEDVKKRFSSQPLTMAVVNAPPVLLYKGGAQILVFDLMRPREPNAKVDEVVENYSAGRFVPPAPPAAFALKPAR